MESAKTESVLDAATEVFGRVGFKKAAVGEIASRAGVGKGTIYLVAASKADLYYRAIAREVAAWTAQIGAAVPLVGDPAEVLRTLLDEESRTLGDRPLVCALLSGRAVAAAPALADRVGGLRLAARKHLRAALRSAARAGVLRLDLDLEEVAVLLQDLQVATLLFHSAPDADEVEREGARYHRWDTLTTALIEGLHPRRAGG